MLLQVGSLNETKGVGRGNAPGSKRGHPNVTDKALRRKRKRNSEKEVLKPGDKGWAKEVMLAKRQMINGARRLAKCCHNTLIVWHPDDKTTTTHKFVRSKYKTLRSTWHRGDTQKIWRQEVRKTHKLASPAEQKAGKPPRVTYLRNEARDAWDELVEAKKVNAALCVARVTVACRKHQPVFNVWTHTDGTERSVWRSLTLPNGNFGL
jgi:hypothetical protein